MSNTLVSWRDVPITSIESGTPQAIAKQSPERVRMMREYQVTGEIYGAFLATPEDLAAADDDDVAELGPSRDEIDWTGLPFGTHALV